MCKKRHPSELIVLLISIKNVPPKMCLLFVIPLKSHTHFLCGELIIIREAF